MRFNANRLATLAGIPTSSNRRSLNEAGNQSRHDEKYDEGVDWYSGDLSEVDDPEYDPFAAAGEGEFTAGGEEEFTAGGEGEFAAGGEGEMAMVDDLDPELNPELDPELDPEVGDLALEFDMGDPDDPAMMSDEELELVGEEVVEINETMLRREISRMRRERAHRANSRSVQLQEERHLRNAIKSEIGSILGELGERRDLYTTRHWLYGDRKPRNSKHGYVARGGFGIGFE